MGGRTATRLSGDGGGSALEPLVELLVVQLAVHAVIFKIRCRPCIRTRPRPCCASPGRAPAGDRVEWRRGTAELIEPASADLVIMSGNVAMHLIDQDWLQEPTERTTAAGRLVESEATSTPDADGVVVHRWRTEYSDEGVDRVWSDWHGRPFDAAEHPLKIIEACPQGA
ncbi:hypothetical protein [Micrococcus luteus]|uniref:hypothetical protein n=2 Tax=Micrococcus luteus TaxID=1270 RepID=UPI002005E999|nr:hypothetical protein [Micrococcus luteus]